MSRRELATSATFFVLTFLSCTYTYGAGTRLPFREALPEGLIFAGALMAILLAHELGHYVVARLHGFDLSLPIFLPLPVVSAFGTLGAVIRLRSQPRSRQALLEMGAAGPIAGAVVAFLLLAVFLPHFRPPPVLPEGVELAYLNDPLVAKLLGLLLTGEVPPLDANWHPAAFAGWVGCLLTGINLVPIGQLDGGHVLSAAFPGSPRVVSRVLLLLAFLGTWFFVGWAVMALVVLLIGAYRPLPVPVDGGLPLRSRLIAGAIVLLFLVTFIPVPIVGNGLVDALLAG